MPNQPNQAPRRPIEASPDITNINAEAMMSRFLKATPAHAESPIKPTIIKMILTALRWCSCQPRADGYARHSARTRRRPVVPSVT